MGRYNRLTPEERARITEIQDSLIDLYVEQKEALEEGRKVVITGDINTAHTELDIYNPKKYATETGFMDSERGWITGFLQGRKCVDVWREFNPGVRKYTFWDQKRCTHPTPLSQVPMIEGEDGSRIRVDFFSVEGEELWMED